MDAKQYKEEKAEKRKIVSQFIAHMGWSDLIKLHEDSRIDFFTGRDDFFTNKRKVNSLLKQKCEILKREGQHDISLTFGDSEHVIYFQHDGYTKNYVQVSYFVPFSYYKEQFLDK